MGGGWKWVQWVGVGGIDAAGSALTNSNPSLLSYITYGSSLSQTEEVLQRGWTGTRRSWEFLGGDGM